MEILYLNFSKEFSYNEQSTFGLKPHYAIKRKTERKKPNVNANYSSRLSKSNLFVQSSRKLQEMEENQYQEENHYGQWKLKNEFACNMGKIQSM